MKILAIDLGKYNSVACLFDTNTNQSEFETIATQRWSLEQLLKQTQPNQIVIETSSITGWVHDFCQSLGYQVLVANPSAEAWRWKNVKRKTDKDDALKLAKLRSCTSVSKGLPKKEKSERKGVIKIQLNGYGNHCSTRPRISV